MFFYSFQFVFLLVFIIPNEKKDNQIVFPVDIIVSLNPNKILLKC